MAELRRSAGPFLWLLLALGAIRGLARLWSHHEVGLAGVDAPDLQAGHETSDMSARAVAGLGIGLMAALAVVVLAATLLQLRLTGPPAQLAPSEGVASVPAEALPAAPRLETTPGETVTRVRATEQERLHTYGWVSRENAIARIPIDLAMDLIVQRGLPAQTSSSQSQTQVTLPSDSSSGRVEERVWP
ncbi:MAG TPA: hypothetical protein VHX16_05165 [Chloroflexota bacterium]|jgi:hypothetical protein|nr:hypothetical protein [Chloroflexota bacterium]